MRGFRIVAVAAAIAVYGQVVLGSVVRITGSGLGCPDWPACQGRLIPNFADSHVVIEYAHRLVGSAAGLLMVATAGLAILLYMRQPDGETRMPRGLALASAIGVLLIVFQGVLGGITVLTGNTPFTVAIHLGNALLVLGAALLVALWAGRLLSPSTAAASAVSRERGAIFGGAVAAFLIVLSGAYVVGTGAGAACAGWPACGATDRSALTDIHMLHRIVVMAGSALILAAVWYALRRWRGTPMAMVAYATAGVLLVEVAVGAAQALLALPAPLRAAHVALASAVWTGTVLMAGGLWLETLPEPVRAQSAGRSLAGAGAKS